MLGSKLSIQTMLWGTQSFLVIMSLIVVVEVFAHLVLSTSFVPVIEMKIGPICHHIPERTLVFKGELPVCARCTGLYLGFMLAVVCAPFHNFLNVSASSRQILTISLLVFLLSALLAIFETWQILSLSNATRLILGLGLGIAPAVAVCIAMKELAWKLKHTR